MHLDKTEIPSGNIMDRWRKDADKDPMEGASGEVSVAKETAVYLRKQLMLKRVLDIAGVNVAVDEPGYADAVEALDRLIAARSVAPVDVQEGVKLGVANGATRPTACPARPSRKGRPQNSSLKSYEESVKRGKKSKRSAAGVFGVGVTDEENPSGGKTKTLAEIVGVV